MKCTRCEKDIFLQCSDDEPHRISGEPVCEKCYFRELGDMMERHPPGIHPTRYKKVKNVATVEQINDAIARCLEEIRYLDFSTELSKHRGIILTCNIDVLRWILGEEDEKVLGIKSWKDLKTEYGDQKTTDE